MQLKNNFIVSTYIHLFGGTISRLFGRSNLTLSACANMITQSIEQLIFALQWKRSANKVLIIVSDDMLEYMCWNNLLSASFISKFVILPLDQNDSRSHFKTHIERYGFDHIIVITKHIKRYVISLLKDIGSLLSPQGNEVGTSAPVCSKFWVDLITSDTSSVSPYTHIEQSLLPLQCSITHFPAYSLDLLGGGPREGTRSGSHLQAFGMVSAIYRNLSPLVYAQMNFDHLDSLTPVPQRLDDITTSLLPTATTRKLLKGFAAELHGLLEHDLQVNVKGHIYSKGKTASLVAQSVQQLANDKDKDSELHGNTWSGERSEGGGLACAALVLLDRSTDLDALCLLDPTSGTHGIVEPPFVQRVLATIPRKKLQYHTNSENADSPPKFAYGFDLSLINAPAIVSQQRVCSVPSDGYMPCKVSPSLAPPCTQRSDCGHEETEKHVLSSLALRRSMLLEPEEKFLRSLRTELTKNVKDRGGTLPPPRKREVGPEVLALTQALLVAPTTASGGVGGESTSPLLEQIPLLTLANTVLESLGRSGCKATVGSDSAYTWKCSWDERRLRERALLESVDKEGFLGGLEFLKEQIKMAGKVDTDAATPADWGAVADIEHWLLMLGQLFIRRKRQKPRLAARSSDTDAVGGWAEEALDFLDNAASDLAAEGGNEPPQAGGEEEDELGVEQIRSLMGFDDLVEVLSEYLVSHCALDELDELCRPAGKAGRAGLLCPDLEEIQLQSRSRRVDVNVVAVIKRLRGKCASDNGSASTDHRNGDKAVDLDSVVAREAELQEDFLHMDSSFREDIADKEQKLRRSMKTPEEVRREEEKEEELWVRLGLERRITHIVTIFIELRATSFRNNITDTMALARTREWECIVEFVVSSLISRSGHPSGSIDAVMSDLQFGKPGSVESITDSLAKAGLGWMFGGNTDATEVETTSPEDPEIVVIFVIGGLSYIELSLVEKVLKSHSDVNRRFIIGTTEMKSPLELISSAVCPSQIT